MEASLEGNLLVANLLFRLWKLVIIILNPYRESKTQSFCFFVTKTCHVTNSLLPSIFTILLKDRWARNCLNGFMKVQKFMVPLVELIRPYEIQLKQWLLGDINLRLQRSVFLFRWNYRLKEIIQASKIQNDPKCKEFMEKVGYIQLANEKSMQSDDISVFHEWRNSAKIFSNSTTTIRANDENWSEP